MSDSRLQLVQGDITQVTGGLFTPWELDVYQRALAGEPERT